MDKTWTTLLETAIVLNTEYQGTYIFLQVVANIWNVHVTWSFLGRILLQVNINVRALKLKKKKIKFIASAEWP